MEDDESILVAVLQVSTVVVDLSEDFNKQDTRDELQV